jgi:hypothetical protein
MKGSNQAEHVTAEYGESAETKRSNVHVLTTL